MQGRIVADPRTLVGHAGELGTVAAQFEQEAYQLRARLGFLINRPDIPNGAALMSSYMTALQSLDGAAASSRQLSAAVARHAQRVVACENTLLRSGDGPYARPWSGPGIQLPSAGDVAGFGWNILTNSWGVADALAALSAPWSRNAIMMRILNKAPYKELRAILGSSPKTANAIIKARESGRFKTLDDLRRAGLERNKLRSSRPVLEKAALARRMQLAQQLQGKFGQVGRFVGTKGSWLAGKLSPAGKYLSWAGKGFAVLDLYGSVTNLRDQFIDLDHDDENQLGGAKVEAGMAVVRTGTAVGGTAVMLGLVTNPVGIAVVGGFALAVGAYYAAPYVWKGGKWVAGKIGDGVGYVGGKIGDGVGYVGGKVGDGVGYVGDKVGDAKDAAVGAARDTIEDAGRAAGAVKDAVGDKADDVKDAVSDKADDVKDAVGSKLGGAKDAVSKKFGGLF